MDDNNNNSEKVSISISNDKINNNNNNISNNDHLIEKQPLQQPRIEINNSDNNNDNNNDNKNQASKLAKKESTKYKLLRYLSSNDAPPLMTFEWKSIFAEVPKSPNNKKEFKTILNKVSGKIMPGELVALMGPSGAGKSSLLNILGSRFNAKDGKYSGKILINNENHTKKFKKYLGYVLQNDVLLNNLTVYETLEITAKLRLPSTLSTKQKLERVDDIIYIMGLNSCKNTLIKHVSGGEKKRVSIANELLINPSVLFLDEPTSGLDSTSAYSILNTLKILCNEGRTVICAIHQPSSQMFMKFDKLLLLASGEIIYFGKATDAVNYLSSVGYPCPNHYNPADFILELVTDNFSSDDQSLSNKEEIKVHLISEWKKRMATDNDNNNDNDDNINNNNNNNNMQLQSINNNNNASLDDETNEEKNSSKLIKKKKKSRWNASWFEQFLILYMRAFKHRRGNIWSWLRVVEIVGVAFLGGLVWFRMKHTENNMQDWVAAVFFIQVYINFTVMYRGVVHFPLERDVIIKERQSGAYRLSAYYISKIFAEFPVDSFLPIIAVTMFYWFVGFADSFVVYLIYILTTCLTIAASNSFGILLGCSVSKFDYAFTLLAVLGIFMMSLSGFMVKDRAIPDWIGWLKYLSFLRYGYISTIHVVLSYTVFKCSEPSNFEVCNVSDANYNHGEIEGSTILKSFGVNENYDFSVGLLVLLMFAWYSLGFMFLRRCTSIKY